MITLEHIIAFALRERTVLDRLADALRSDLVIANPYYRRITEFADTFALEHRQLPQAGDWDVWMASLPTGMIRDGTRDALSHIFAVDTSTFHADYFATQALDHLRATAAQTAVSRLNAVHLHDVTPELLTTLADQVDAVHTAGLQNLVPLSDVDTWLSDQRDDVLVPTGFPTLDHFIGGWGQELWLCLADTGVGKTMILQNWATAAAVRGKHVLHVTLELGIRPQILRYYRQITRATRGEMRSDEKRTREKLNYWFRMAAGSVHLMEFTAYSLDPPQLQRTIERVNRNLGAPIDLLILDYLDLMSLPKHVRSQGKYEDLGYLTHQVRGVCRTLGFAVVSATQAVRRPEKKGRLTVHDMGDSYNKVRGADGIVALQQTGDEKKAHQGRLSLIKVRDAGGWGLEIPLYMNGELSVIAELKHPTTIKLMTRLGHLPVDETSPPDTPETTEDAAAST